MKKAALSDGTFHGGDTGTSPDGSRFGAFSKRASARAPRERTRGFAAQGSRHTNPTKHKTPPVRGVMFGGDTGTRTLDPLLAKQVL